MKQIQRLIKDASIAVLSSSKVSSAIIKNQIHHLCNVTTFSHIDQLLENPHGFNLIITDRILEEGKKAEDLVKALKENPELEKMPVIVVTSNEWLEWEYPQHHPDFVLPKPFPQDLLIDMISQLILLRREEHLNRERLFWAVSDKLAEKLSKIFQHLPETKVLKALPEKAYPEILRRRNELKAVIIEGEDNLDMVVKLREEGFIPPILVIGTRSFAQMADEAFRKGATLYISEHELTSGYIIERLLELGKAEFFKEKLPVLLVEDSQLMRNILSMDIFNQGYPVAAVSTAEEALRLIKLNKMLVTIINLNLPGKSGTKLVEEIRDLPLKDYEKLTMIYTSTTNPLVTFEAFYAGANDFIRAPFNLCDFYVRIYNLVRLRRHLYDLEQSREQLYHMGTKDPLTGLFNRRFLMEVMTKALEASRRYQKPFSIILIDANWFKHINDTYGHTVGDRVLLTLADKLKSLVRGTDVVARYGGDEFLILLPETDRESCEELARRIKEHINGSTLKGYPEITLSVSTGCASFSELGEDDLKMGNQQILHTLISIADRRMYEDKKKIKKGGTP